jgi:hypothetical protein
VSAPIRGNRWLQGISHRNGPLSWRDDCTACLMSNVAALALRELRGMKMPPGLEGAAGGWADMASVALAVVPWLCVSAFRRICSGQRCCVY